MHKKVISTSLLTIVFASSLLLYPTQPEAAPRSTLNIAHSTSCWNGSPRVSLTWNNVNNAHSYIIHRNPTLAGKSGWASIATVSGLTYTSADNLKSGSEYQYQVEASSTSGSRFSSIVSIKMPQCESLLPASHPTLQGKAQCIDDAPSVQLSWTNPNNATSFILHRAPNIYGTNSWATRATTATETSFLDLKVAPGTYQYQVQTSGSSSLYSNIASVTVASCAVPPAPATTTRPLLSVSMQCVDAIPQITLSWTNPNSATSFTMHRNPTRGNTNTWGSLATEITSISYVDTKIATGTYQYQVQTHGGLSSVSQYSNIASITVTNCATSSPGTSQSTTTPKTYAWGVYSGWSNADMQEFETRVGENPNHMAAFVHWANNQFPTYMEPFTKAKGRTLIIFWEPSDYLIGGTVQENFTADAILAGRWDAYIRKFATDSATYGSPIILIPFSEMNGNWNPWSGTTNGNTPEKVVAAYRHVRTVFGNVPNVKFGWAPNAQSVPNTDANAIERYYPGDSYVDIVGVDGFNFGDPWLSFDQVFNKALTTISAYNKPMYIFSFASDAGYLKASWITDALTVQLDKWPLIAGWVWFNQNKENNWLIWSDAASLSAFKNAIP